MVALAPVAAGLGGAVAAQATTTWWHPGPITSWAYVIGENYPLAVPTSVGNVQAYDSDLGDESGLASSGAPLVDKSISSSVTAIHNSGAHAICYVDAGTAENWRSDYGKFDPSELGGADPGWPGEEFINVTDWAAAVPSKYETLQTIMANRIALCKAEGFDAIEADNVDAYSDGNIGTFTLTMTEEETYINNLLAVAHGDGLAFFLKNEINGDSLISTEAPKVDGEIDEQCWQYSECSALSIFVKEGKPVLNVEYKNFTESALCPKAKAFPMATIHTDLNLDGKIAYGCWQYASATAGTATAAPTTTTKATTTTTKATTTTTKAATATRVATTTTQAATTTTRAATTTTRETPTTKGTTTTTQRR